MRTRTIAATKAVVDATTASRKVTQAASLIEALTRYRFRDKERLYEALDVTGTRTPQSNSRLAMVGDSVLKQVLLEHWYPSGGRKVLATNLLSKYATNANLAVVADELGIRKCLITNMPSHVSGAVLATTMEAIIGAAYLDADKSWAVAREVMDGFGLKPASADLVNSATPDEEDVNPSSAPPVVVDNVAPPPKSREQSININISVPVDDVAPRAESRERPMKIDISVTIR
ncbi:hypothetical protein LTS02_012068 [Friedmanniomyces endolithicus]|uniref:RNase III domain-containing protein n=1 Tax=Friedmanniomyces simplex TaxID=329884 RepID=A0A4U0X1E6_9PEZI|nr:hypothetical protein LTR94_017476 [Friedmanniomyces endolithicus]TKA68908.1 hypothetical protein B0A55_07846 [Friedmanniomyces simplex]KAK0774862.1 hypothetical protein LTR59_014725 [Friedmanniomyces endolithicus]KAK0778982.1 hypothetical protein LTR38_014594 [Friedmanniomyces endolithicus]KAK0782766.1 hypothetical protein LTR75_014305 [Friedmanniomyces endolithicus]